MLNRLFSLLNREKSAADFVEHARPYKNNISAENFKTGVEERAQQLTNPDTASKALKESLRVLKSLD